MKPRYSAAIVLIIEILIGALYGNVELFLLCAITYYLLLILFKIKEDEK